MEGIAHDTSGPAPPKPGDIAPQQASRPDLPDRGKLRVFISYSREDLDFVDQLNVALNACGFESVIDRDRISGGEDWKRRLGSLISEADTVVFVLSPTWMRSEICEWELEEAIRLGKRIFPINCRPLEYWTPPPQLRGSNYIFFYADPKAPGSGFGAGLARLAEALNTDFEWLREHTRYLQRATEWDGGGRPANRLLSGDDIAEAKAWAARRPKNAPEPTALHLDFIRASEEEAEARSSAQRKQFEAMAAAQAERERALHKAEEALKQVAHAQRNWAVIIKLAPFVGASFLLLAVWLIMPEDPRTRARIQEINDVSIQLQQINDAKIADAVGYLGWLYENGQGVAQDYDKAREWFVKAAEKGNADAMAGLGRLYQNGHGVSKDYAKARAWYEKSAATRDAKARLEELRDAINAVRGER